MTKDTPTRRYDLMMMRVDEIQGLVTILQQRRVQIQNTEKKIRANKAIGTHKSNDAELSKFMDKMERLLTRMQKDHDDIEKLLNKSRGLIYELSNGEILVEKING